MRQTFTTAKKLNRICTRSTRCYPTPSEKRVVYFDTTLRDGEQVRMRISSFFSSLTCWRVLWRIVPFIYPAFLPYNLKKTYVAFFLWFRRNTAPTNKPPSCPPKPPRRCVQTGYVFSRLCANLEAFSLIMFVKIPNFFRAGIRAQFFITIQCIRDMVALQNVSINTLWFWAPSNWSPPRFRIIV